jgi:hypothetical protein
MAPKVFHGGNTGSNPGGTPFKSDAYGHPERGFSIADNAVITIERKVELLTVVFTFSRAGSRRVELNEDQLRGDVDKRGNKRPRDACCSQSNPDGIDDQGSPEVGLWEGI